ncbi:MAG TPA: single-stranded DNA-binding protein [Chloroflexia bacterium]|nr:single-stranded DNA-binding protein [Chloroflexia bacterium]
MSRTLNKVTLIGHLGKDPDMRYTASGAAVTSFTVATNRYTKAADGTSAEETEWHPVVAWDKLAETCNQFLHKGSKVYLEGRLQTRSWEQDGVKRYKTEIIISEMILLDARQDGANGNGGGTGRREAVGVVATPGEDDGLPF